MSWKGFIIVVPGTVLGLAVIKGMLEFSNRGGKLLEGAFYGLGGGLIDASSVAAVGGIVYGTLALVKRKRK